MRLKVLTEGLRVCKRRKETESEGKVYRIQSEDYTRRTSVRTDEIRPEVTIDLYKERNFFSKIKSLFLKSHSRSMSVIF